ncbi:MAG TPA: transglutaminase family protein [Cytophagaceae bacterium]|nr:transglutaminase family protein [Cytophagaceae bacterium]
MKYKIIHTTEYSYQESVNLCHNRLCLQPVERPNQKCIFSDIRITPKPDVVSFRKDFFGNNILFFSIYKEHSSLKIVSESIVSMENLLFMNMAVNSFLPWKEVQRKISEFPELAEEVTQYTVPSTFIPYSDVIKSFANDCFPEDATLWMVCNDLMQKIYTTIKFTPGYTTINTPVETVIKAKKGVCQDIAHLMIACMRNMGLPARYVSGYIETMAPPGKEKLIGTDASHAWVSVYFPEIGWVEFDPTNCLLPSHHHIVIGYGRDYQDVAPIKGIIFSSGEQKLKVEVDVQRIN